MGSTQRSWQEQTYGPERARSLKSRLFVLLRDELGMGRQPKVARVLVDEITRVVEETLVDASVLRPGQVLVLAPEVGQGPSWRWNRLEDKRMKAVALDLVAPDDIEQLAGGTKLREVRKARLVRLVRDAYEQGVTLTSCQLAVMTGISPAAVSAQLNAHMAATGKLLPTRGIIEDCSPAITHKAMIIARHLEGESTAEIARATDHTPRSVERYVRRFEQVREFVRYVDKAPEPAVIARILGCSERLVVMYLNLLPDAERPSPEA
jgi:DNA-binding CsgD family transcriptional regulator